MRAGRDSAVGVNHHNDGVLCGLFDFQSGSGTEPSSQGLKTCLLRALLTSSRIL